MKGGGTMSDIKEIKARIISLIMTGLVLVLALFTFTKSRAWFVANHETSVDGITVTTETPDAVKTTYYYRGTGMGILVDGAGGRHNQYYFSYDPAVLATQTVQTGTDSKGNPIMTPERDTFFKPVPLLPYSDLAGECQILIKIELPSAGTYTLNTDTKTTSYFGDIIKNKTDNNDFTMNVTNLPMSSVVHFAILTEIENDTTNKRYIADGDIIKENALRYITVEEVDSESVSTFAKPEAKSVTVTEDNLFVYVFVDYYLPAVEHINELMVDFVDKAEAAIDGYNEIVIGESTLKFSPDFSLHVTKKEVAP